MRNLLINIGLAIASVTLFFAAGEIGLRVTGIQRTTPQPPLIYQRNEDPRISLELIPNLRKRAYRKIVTTNSLGFRSPEIDPGKPTIAVLGDSITFGYGLADDETIPARMAQRLDGYNVINAGVPAYQLLQETAVYGEKIQALNPKAVVLIFYFNDFTTQTPWLDDLGIVRAQDYVPGTDPPCAPIETGLMGLVPGRCWLDQHSAIYKVMKKLVTIRTGNKDLAEARKQSQEHPEEDKVTDDKLATYDKQLAEFARLLPLDVPRLFVIWPDRFVHEKSRPRLRAIAEKHGFTVIDLYDTFGNEVPTLTWDTVHPNAKAADTAAEVIVTAIDLP